MIARIKRRWKYRRTWGTPIGRDCISLDASLCNWLSERLTFLAHHHHGFPAESSSEEWRATLLAHAAALAAYDASGVTAGAQQSLRWVADNLRQLWD